MTRMLPQFTTFDLSAATLKFEKLLADNRQKINTLLQNLKSASFETLITPLDDLNEPLNELWALISHLHAVVDSEAIRAVYHAC